MPLRQPSSMGACLVGVQVYHREAAPMTPWVMSQSVGLGLIFDLIDSRAT